MKTIPTLLLAAMFCFADSLLNAQSTPGFTGIKVSDPLKIVITMADDNSVKTDPENGIDRIKTKVEDDLLIITVEGKGKGELPTVLINIKELKNLTVSGSAEAKSANTITSDQLTIISSGAGDINLEVKSSFIKTKISGAGDVKIKGTATTHEVTITGAGELKAINLETDKTIVRASGAGNAKVNVKQSLDADVSGAGSVIYKGDPADRNVNISGAGSVSQINNDSAQDNKNSSISVDISLNDDDIRVEEDTLDPNDPDTTRINFKKMKVLIIENEEGDENTRDTEKEKSKDEDRNKHWSGLYLGVNGFLSPQNSLSLPAKHDFLELNYAKSIHFAFNFLEKDIHLYKDYAMLVTGLGLDFNTYALKNNVTLQANKNSVWGVTDTINKYTRNKLKTTFVNVPVLFAFNTNSDPDKALHFAAGMIFGYDLMTKTKQRYDFGRDEISSKIKNDYNINPFRYSLTAQLGYGNYNLYASYALNSFFKGGKGPEIYPFTLGVRILGL